MATASSDGSVEIREGFLCPICMKDLGTIGQLQLHFETFHSNEDKAVLHSIKDLFGKAKKKILKLESLNDDYVNRPEIDSSSSNDFLFLDDEIQDIGTTRSHLDYFKQIRSSRMDRYVVETNKLLIRLDKLITEIPLDAATRKNSLTDYEKSVVYWVADADVRLCPGCGCRFNISRRKHHCRLCGSIMCANCSKFILFSFAKKLISPMLNSQSLSQPSSPMHHNGSNSSLNSLVNSAGEPHIRVCAQCWMLLDRRSEQMDEHSKQPPITQLYKRLKSCIDEAGSLCPIYSKMADSINSGETNYNLHDAQDLRIKLIRLSENIDILSKRIMVLGRDNPDTEPMNTLLQKSIRNRAANFLQDNVVGLPSLPTEDEHKKLQERRSNLIRKKIAVEKQQALEFHQKLQLSDHSMREESPKKEYSRISQQGKLQNVVETETGWGPDTAASQSFNDDPMVQQMNNIRNFIKQARAAHLYDEVQILEANLKELQKEYWKQQEKCNNQTENFR